MRGLRLAPQAGLLVLREDGVQRRRSSSTEAADAHASHDLCGLLQSASDETKHSCFDLLRQDRPDRAPTQAFTLHTSLIRKIISPGSAGAPTSPSYSSRPRRDNDVETRNEACLPRESANNDLKNEKWDEEDANYNVNEYYEKKDDEVIYQGSPGSPMKSFAKWVSPS